jgi:hypothetical protein
MHPKFIEVGPICRIQFATAVILRIGVVVGDTFAAEIVISTQDPPRDFLRTALIAAIVVGHALILAQK